jgi:pseudolysin/vibriolysin
MRPTTRTLSLTGIALLLAACVETVERPSPVERDVETDLGAPAESDIEERPDTRDSLAPVSSAGARRQRGADLVADARAFAAEIAARAGVHEPRFSVFRSTKGTDGLLHIRLEQRHVVGGESLKVWGADVVVHATDTELVGLSGTLAVDLDRLDPSAPDVLEDGYALELAKRDRFRKREVPTSRESVERIIYVDADSVPHIALRAEFYNELENGVLPGLWNYVFDVKTGELLARWNAIEPLAQASGPGGNAKYPHAWVDALDVEPHVNGHVMTTAQLRTLNMKNTTSGTGTEISGPLDGFDDPAINDAHGYAEVTLRMMKEWMGHDSIDDNGYRIVSRVHYGVNYENAFWNGLQMTYGDGKSTFYPLSGALDVVSHEIHHGFTSKHSNLAYSGEPGGLNESFSDIAGKTAEFFYKDNPTWDLGGDIFRSNGALRYMCTPSKDGRSIDHASKMRPGLDPHYSSGPPNKAFCRMSKRLSTGGDPEGIATKDGVRRAAKVFYLANASYWTSSTKYVQGCQGTVDAARALGYSNDEIAHIKASWADVGIYCDGLTPPPNP